MRILKHNGVNIDLDKASERTCFGSKANGDTFLYIDVGEFQDFPKEHLERLVKSVVEQTLSQKI